jgi:hypothetical protein
MSPWREATVQQIQRTTASTAPGRFTKNLSFCFLAGEEQDEQWRSQPPLHCDVDTLKSIAGYCEVH